MLSELILASVPPKKERDKERSYSGLSCSGLYPCAYRMYKVHRGESWSEPTPTQVLNMEDGWDQEEQAVRRLKRAGIIVKGRGKTERFLTVGRSKIPGSWDGCISWMGEDITWDHKAMNNDSFWLLKTRGMEGFLNYKCQMNSYTLGKGLERYILQGKCKETNEPYDVLGNLDLDFILPIIKLADKIRLGNWIPEPKLGKYCVGCGIDCFGTVLDMSKIGSATAPEMADRWRKGKQLKMVGEALEEEAREYFVGRRDKFGEFLSRGLIGDKDILLVEGLKVSKVPQHRLDISKELLIQEYGPEALLKVGVDKEIITYRISELGGKGID